MTILKSAQLGLLHRADGSVSLTQDSTTIIVSVNGPMESKVRDELPGEAYIEVIVHPAIGVSGTREKYLESRLLSALKPIIIRSNHPRTLIQIVVQIAQAANHNSAASLLSPAINAAVFALIDAAVPLTTVLTSTTVMTGNEEGESRHVLAFTSSGELAFVESEGCFEYNEFKDAVKIGRAICGNGEEDDVSMEGGREVAAGGTIREAVEGKVKKDLRWRY
ncbi:exosome non-catalytic core subunit rrp46 [Rhizina undulata]